MSFLLGAKPSPPDPKDATFAFEKSELLAGVILPESNDVSITDAHEWREQRYQDCVGISIVEVAKDNATVLGHPCPPLAPLLPYNQACFYDQPPAPGKRMPDVGTNPRLGIKAAMHCGLVPESEYPETDENIGMVPPMDVWQSASVARVKSYHRITSRDLNSFRHNINAALKLARDGKAAAPMFAMPVYENYLKIGSSVYESIGGKLLGHHMQPITGRRDHLDAYEVPGSWPRKEFGDNGLALISTSCLYAIGREFWVAIIDFDSFKVIV